MMKKRFPTCFHLLLGLLLTVAILASCGGGKTETTSGQGTTAPVTEPGSEPATDPSTEPSASFILSASDPGTVVYRKGATGNEMGLVLAVRDVIRSVTGVNPEMKSDADLPTPSGCEIAVGATNRSVSASAAGEAAPSEDDGAYGVCREAGSVALYYSAPEAMTVGYDRLLTALRSAAADGEIDLGKVAPFFETFSIPAYYEGIEAEKRAAYLAEYDHRWDEAASVLTPEALASLRAYYDMCGDGIIEWAASLWEPEIGGFYYADSARDYAGFLPDVESTKGILDLLSDTGMIDYYGDLDDALPADMKAKLVSFVLGLQDPDGYFYHPQWGKTVNSSRRGRDLNWSSQILSAFGATPTYKTPIDQLSDDEELALHSDRFRVTLARLLADSGEGNDSIPDYLKSEDAFLAYMQGLNIPHNSHSGGHTLSSQASQIEAAGLLDVCCDYLASIQRSDNGLWEEGINYTTISGMYKISGIFVRAGRTLQYVDKIVDSCISCIKSEESPSVIIYVMNPWGSLSRLIDTMKNENKKRPGTYDLDALIGKIRENAKDLIDVTVEKLLLFRHDDGSFSYNVGYSAPITQGVPVSLGMDEGDVNAAVKPFCGIMSYMSECFGIERVDFFNFTHFERFMEIVNAATVPEKISLTTDQPITFEDAEDGTLPLRVSSTISSTGTELSYAGTVTDPTDPTNRVLKLTTEPDSITKGIFDSANDNSSYQCYVFEAKMNLVSGDDGRVLQILLGANSNLSFELCFDVSGKTYNIFDSATTADAKHSNDLGIKLEIGKWYTIRVEYYPGDRDTAAGKVMIDGHCYAISRNWYNGESDPNANPIVAAPQSTTVNLMKARAASILLDDVRAYFEDKAFSSADLEKFPEPEGASDAVSVTKTFDDLTGVGTISSSKPDTRSLVSDPANGENKVLQIDSSARTADTSGSSVAIQLSDKATDAVKKTFSFRIRVPSRGENKFTDFFTSTGNAVLYQLFTMSDNKKYAMMNVKTYCADAAAPKGDKDASAVVTGFYFVFVSDTSNSNADECSEILALDTWYEITLCFEMDEIPSITLSIGGVEKKTTDVFYLTSGAIDYVPKGAVAFNVTTLKRTRGILLLDDLAYVETENEP